MPRRSLARTRLTSIAAQPTLPLKRVRRRRSRRSRRPITPICLVRDVAKGTAKAFIPDAASIVPEVVGGIGSAIKHTYDTKELPGKGLIEGTDAWVNRKLSGYAPETMKMVNKAIGYTPPTDAEYEAKVKPATDAASAMLS